MPYAIDPPCQWPGCPFASSRIVYPQIGPKGINLCVRHVEQYRSMDYAEVHRMEWKIPYVKPKPRRARGHAKLKAA